MEPRRLDPGQRSAVWITDVINGTTRLLHESRDVLLEAPNWALDGEALYVNGGGRLWRLPLAGGRTVVPLTAVPDLNNDHVLDPDGKHVYVSANDWNLYRAPLAGGAAQLVTTAPPVAGLMHFLHGVSPDGKRLAFIGIDPTVGWTGGRVWTVAVDGTDYQQLTHANAPADGSEYSPDGEWIYFNTEQFDGHAQIGRIRVDGSGLEQLTFDDNVNWFPHLPATGPYAVYVAFPPGTEGHPPDVEVQLKLVTDGAWAEARTIATVYGGQGTINVHSWSPDGRSFAYVSHDRDLSAQDAGVA